MIGIIVLLAISQVLLYLFAKQNLLALGFLPLSKRILQFLLCFLISAVLCTLVQYLEAQLISARWIWNEKVTAPLILQSFWYDVKSVFTEELVFRGALLYLLIQKIGSTKGVLISAVAFGIYHWFSYGIIGQPVAMIFVFIGTGLMGYAWALAFAKGTSILLPFGFHLGWNVLHNTVFSKGPLGSIILIPQGGEELNDWLSLLHFSLGMIIAPIVVALYVKYFVSPIQDASH